MPKSKKGKGVGRRRVPRGPREREDRNYGVLDARFSLRDAGNALVRGARMAAEAAAWFNVEEKMSNYAASAATTTAGAVTYLSNIGQGADYNQRGGNSIKVMGAEFHAYCTPAVASTVVGEVVRCLLFVDNECHGAAAAVTDVLEAATPQSPLNHAESQRFGVLADFKFTPSISAAPGVADSLVRYGGHIRYTGTTANIGDAYEGSIFALILDGGNQANHPTLTFYFRTYFVDN